MAIEIFNRHENKYRLDERTFNRLQHRISEYTHLDGFSSGNGFYPILNIYYDTPGNDLIRASIGKPSYKEKLRLRSYGTPGADSDVYIEIKKKVAGVTNKRRSGMKPCEAHKFLDSGAIPDIQPYMNVQVLREIAYMLERKPLSPKLCLSYDRTAYVGERDLRVSFDTNIQTRRYDLRLESGAYGEQLLGEGEHLMEIKTAESIPLWLSGLLAEYKVYPCGFSKYGEEYQRSLAGTDVGKVYIFIPGTRKSRQLAGSFNDEIVNARREYYV
jgi:hypothetical protein